MEWEAAPSKRVPNFVESSLGPETLSVEMELFTLRLCGRLSSMPAVPSSRKWVRDPGRLTQASHSSQDLTSILQLMGDDAFDGHGLSSSMGTELRAFRCWRPEVGSDDFRGVRKFKKLPARCSSSELSAHQMARGRPALEPKEILSSVKRRARCTPLRDGDS